jgi:hypothetical protein
VPATENTNPADPKTDAGSLVPDSQKPAGAQHHETDHKFLTEHARRSGAGENSGQVTFGDGVQGRSLPKAEDVHTDAEDAVLRSGQKTVNQLQSDLDTLAMEIEDLERPNGVSVRKKPGRLK